MSEPKLVVELIQKYASFLQDNADKIWGMSISDIASDLFCILDGEDITQDER